ncbi:hypothetical protein DFJ74DRAFT_698178 [Hyaloraphidium curvatum]|nr:hypothetical protein DFJ74DRAFT_698178 [Hyaloraphidium curvatum]
MRNLSPRRPSFALSSCQDRRNQRPTRPRWLPPFRAGLGATWTFLFGPGPRPRSNDSASWTPPRASTQTSRGPSPSSSSPGLAVRRVWDGCGFAGRPTVEELRMEVRQGRWSRFSNYGYAGWAAGLPELGKSGLPVARGTVSAFDLGTGTGRSRGGTGAARCSSTSRRSRGTGTAPCARGTGGVRGRGERDGPTARNVRADKDGA